MFVKVADNLKSPVPSSAGPSGIKNLNPEIFRDGILPNPGIPGFFGMGFPNIFYPGISGKSFGIFRDFHFCFICLSNRIIFINLYHHLRHNHHPPPHYHQIYVRNHIVTMPMLVLMYLKDFSPECGVLCAL